MCQVSIQVCRVSLEFSGYSIPSKGLVPFRHSDLTLLHGNNTSRTRVSLSLLRGSGEETIMADRFPAAIQTHISVWSVAVGIFHRHLQLRFHRGQSQGIYFTQFIASRRHFLQQWMKEPQNETWMLCHRYNSLLWFFISYALVVPVRTINDRELLRKYGKPNVLRNELPIRQEKLNRITTSC